MSVIAWIRMKIARTWMYANRRSRIMLDRRRCRAAVRHRHWVGVQRDAVKPGPADSRYSRHLSISPPLSRNSPQCPLRQVQAGPFSISTSSDVTPRVSNVFATMKCTRANPMRQHVANASQSRKAGKEGRIALQAPGAPKARPTQSKGSDSHSTLFPSGQLQEANGLSLCLASRYHQNIVLLIVENKRIAHPGSYR